MLFWFKQVWATAVVLVVACSAVAQSNAGIPIQLDATLSEDGRSVELRWNTTKIRAVATIVSRRPLGATGAKSWTEIARLPGQQSKTTDNTIEPGTAYEYRVLRSDGKTLYAGYWVVGQDVPAPQDRGTVFIALDETIADPLERRLERLQDDLIGAGWQVRWLKTPRNQPGKAVETLAAARALKDQLRQLVNSLPKGQRHMLMLLGHVPLVKSGMMQPDGHKAVPHESDLFYGDLSGRWRDDGAGNLLHNRLPDGDIEMPIGRIDFAPITKKKPLLEIAYLRAYLDKSHHWRHGMLGDIRAAYGQSEHLLVEQYDLRNIVGPSLVRNGGHHDLGEARPWLWGADFGHWEGAKYPGYALKPVFAINFGSGKQKIGKRNNALTGTLAQPFYTVAVAWGGRPSWRLHPMALGWPIGRLQQITVNNGARSGRYPDGMDYVPTGILPWRAPIWVNLLGDPTLSAFPLAPPERFEALTQEAKVTLRWHGKAERYQLLRAVPGEDYKILGETKDQSFIDVNPVPDARYQLRALDKQMVYAGSFRTASQGIFAQTKQPLPAKLELRQDITGPGPQLLSLDRSDMILAPIKEPGKGQLTLGAEGWYYTPEPGFSGVVDIAISVSGSGQTTSTSLQLSISP